MSGKHQDAEPIPIDGQHPMFKVEAKLVVAIKTDAPELLDFSSVPTEIDGCPSIEIPGWLAKKPPHPVGKGWPLGSSAPFFGHVAPSPCKVLPSATYIWKRRVCV